MVVSTQKTTIEPSNIKTLYAWLLPQLSPSAASWLDQTIYILSTEATEQVLFTRFSAVPRQVGKADWALTDQDLKVAQDFRTGWKPSHWSVDQAARTLLLLAFPSTDTDRYVAAIEKLFSAADVAEQVALYQTLPLLPYPERFKTRAIEGLRTNIKAVFNAISLNNPYPADYFQEAAWNQMILKAIFVDSHLSQIQGLDQRANPKLAQMLSDYAHERWAAGRAVNPQLWRLLGPFAEGHLVNDLEQVLSSPELFEQQAGALACASAAAPDAQALLDKVPTLKQAIEVGQLTWETFSISYP
jgi:hypothetical protein